MYDTVYLWGKLGEGYTGILFYFLQHFVSLKLFQNKMLLKNDIANPGRLYQLKLPPLRIYEALDQWATRGGVVSRRQKTPSMWSGFRLHKMFEQISKYKVDNGSCRRMYKYGK